MASSKDYKEYVMEQLSGMDEIMCRPMMGEFLLYYKGVIFGGIYDNRFLIKQTKNNEEYGFMLEKPYPNGKLMFLVEDIEDKDKLHEIVENTYLGLLSQQP